MFAKKRAKYYKLHQNGAGGGGGLDSNLMSSLSSLYGRQVNLARVHRGVHYTIGGSKNTNFQNSMGALSNPISFALRISKQFLFLF